MTIPKGPEEVSAAWFVENLGWNVTDVEIEEIGSGLGVMSAVYRARLTGTDVPETVVMKLTAKDPSNAFTSMVLRMYSREAAFFDQLADAMPVLVPAGHYSEVSEDGAQFVVVMDDLAGNRMLDQTAHMDDIDAERCIDNLAVWHANWWNKTEGKCDSGIAVALSDPLYPALLPALFDEGWAKLLASSGCKPPAALEAIGPKFGAAIAGLLQQLSEGPLTLLHGDYRTDNMMFTPADEVLLMDFQLIGVGAAAYDLAYFVGSCLDVDAERERELFDRWITRLVEAGVDRADLGDMWEKYRVASLFCLVYPGVACRGMDLDVPRERDLANIMLSRQARAAVDLDWASLLS